MPPIAALTLTVAIMLLTVASALKSSDVLTLQELWRLPLGITPLPLGPRWNAIVVDADDSNIYAADGRGVILAVQASTGRLLWSNAGMEGVLHLQCFDEIPEILYLFQRQSETLFTLYALRRTDGTILNVVQNLTQVRLAPTANGTKIALPYKNGIRVMDSMLSVVYWTVAGGPEWPSGEWPVAGIWFRHLAANNDMVVSGQHNGSHVCTALLAFEVATGKLLCRLDNISISPDHSFGFEDPFSLDSRARTVVWIEQYAQPSLYNMYPQVGDLRKCSAYNTDRVNYWALEGGAVSLLVPTAQANASEPQDALFFGLSRELLNSTSDGQKWGNWVITHSQLGSNETLWNLTLTAPPITGLVAESPAPVIVRVPGRSDRIHVWLHGFLSKVDAASGEVIWNFTSQIPYAPPLYGWNTPIAFPIGDSSHSSVLLVPNLLGFTLIDSTLDQVLSRHLDPQDPLVATFSFTFMANSATPGSASSGSSSDNGPGTQFIVSVTTSGALVARG